MRVGTPAGVAAVAGAVVVGGLVAFAQTSGATGQAAQAPSSSPARPSFSASPSSPSKSPSPSVSAKSAKPATPSPTPSASPTTAESPVGETGPPAGTRLVLSASRVGPVSLPADADAAAEALTPILGKPFFNSTSSGCAAGGQQTKRRALWWADDLEVYGDTRDGVTVTSWAVRGRSTRVPVDLPYGVEIEMSYAEVEAKVPDATRGKSAFGATTLTKGGIVWTFGNGVGKHARVMSVSLGVEDCIE